MLCLAIELVEMIYVHTASVINALSKRISIFLALMLCVFNVQAAETELLDVEKDELKLGFIKLTDMAPLAIAYEKGYFEDEGLYVTLEPQANWKVLLDGVITGELDGAHKWKACSSNQRSRFKASS